MAKYMFLLLAIFYIITAPITFAAETKDQDITTDAKNYQRAYNLCSPASHKKTIEQCNYSKLVESIYILCMRKSGYNEDLETIPDNNYSNYFRTHNICTNSANSEAQKECKYNELYQKHYTACMEELGFNSHGERIKSAEKKIEQDDNPTSPAKGRKLQSDTGVGARKFFDLFL